MKLSIRRFTGNQGERFAMLVDELGMPLFYPALFVTCMLRGGGLAINTIINALTAIKAMYAWQDYYGLELESRFKRSELLLPNEIHSLRDFMQIPLAPAQQLSSNVRAIKQSVRVVSSESQYSRMSVIAEYLKFLAGRLHPHTEVSSAAIAQMSQAIKDNRPKKDTRSNTDREDNYLDEEVLAAVTDALEPGSEKNPVFDYAVQVRNSLMFVILRATGMRRGELLNLKVEDFSFNKRTVKVVRRPDSRFDPRLYQPLAKTLGRTIPLSNDISDAVMLYIQKFRTEVPGSNKHGYLFVTHKAGRFQGQPLSNSGFGKFMSQLAASASDFKSIHAHALRHHWNYDFSKIMDANGVSPEKEQQLRAKLLGWTQTSQMPARYNSRRIKEQAGIAVVAMQERVLGKKNQKLGEGE
ncbi:site-specific integrase [Pseudomonas sp. 21LCFQ010]|uniref:tyrosine-type recombinase/integrase n=1 Tax=Pseudomonas sp. 21LCFQ010 TaxID=2957506 RepID=UPI0020985A07|nr:site-specific integrase [Pseudomonas sp. 21LCFQ010]MCO8165836.1 site-specific integrase [Pseudomonas sp. 21LCFQ010]